MNEEAVTKVNLIKRMEAGWNDFQAYLATLSEAQLTQPADPAGWTAKDHIIHMAMWEGGVTLLFDGKPRWETMGVDQATWQQGEDAINDAIFKRYHDMPLDEVLHTFRQKHEELVAKINTLKDEDLLRPYNAFQPDSDNDDPVFGWVVGNSFMHYVEHRPWIEKIVG